MILQSLCALYDREVAAGRDLPGMGYERKAIDLVLDLDAEGRVIARTPFNERSERYQTNVPRWPVRSGKRSGDDIKSAFLADKAEYVLGFNVEKAAAWARYHRKHLTGTDDEGLTALLRFLDAPGRGLEREGLKGNMTVAFLYDGGFLHERPAARAIWQAIMPRGGDVGRCLMSGEEAPVADLHLRVTVGGSMAALVSYNEEALEHYGHEGGGNSPISEVAAHAYATALDHLIARGHRVTIGTTVLAYWTEIEDTSAAETADQLLADILIGKARPDAKAETAQLRDALAALACGKPVSGVMPEAYYCILAIEPGIGRHAIRSFLRASMGELARNVSAHREAMRLEADDRPHSIRQIAEAVQRDSDRLNKDRPKPSPSLGNDLLRCVVVGAPYPAALINGILARLRAGDEVDGLRAAVLKANLIRNIKEPLTVTCNPDHPSAAYQLGRLLAAVEAVQRAAMPHVNVTARERYWRMLSARPSVALPGLMGGLTHHLGALRREGKGRLAAFLDRQVQEVADRIGEVPGTMSIADQSLLALGYYQECAAKDARMVARVSEHEAVATDVNSDQE